MLYEPISYYYRVKCDKCKSVISMHTKNTERAIERAKAKTEIHKTNGCGGTLRYFPHPEEKQNTKIESKPVALIPNLYNELKLNKIRKSTCTSCPFKPEECLKSPVMLYLCQTDTLDYRLWSGKYNTGTGVDEFSEDINGIIIDGTPVYIEDIWRLFIARTDTFALYKAEDFGKQVVRAPETHQPPTKAIALRALKGGIPIPFTIGVRPVDPKTNLCKWICYDIDKHSCETTIYKSNPRQVVDEIVKRLKDWYGLTGYIELSGSPDSYHIWVFIEQTDYGLVKKFDESFKERCEPTINQAICKRVESGEGHMIKLPYTINFKNGVRSKFIDGVDIHKNQPEKLKF